MSATSILLAEIDGRVHGGTAETCARTLARLTDLFVNGADRLRDAEIAVFDDVILRFVQAIGIPARVELAGRLAPLGNAPPATILLLARDEIVVARPVLAMSPRLDDQALMAIALDLGRDHMLAICERPALATAVTDVLVSHGDGVVRHAVATNRGARFSAMAVAMLTGHAGRDLALVELLRDRTDLSPRESGRLAEIAQVATARLRAAPSASDRDGIALDPTFRPERRPGAPQIGEAALAGLAARGETALVVQALAALTGLPPVYVGRILAEPENDLLFVFGRARGWRWDTIRALLGMRAPAALDPARLHRARKRFEALEPETAMRVLHFVKLRENALIRPAASPPI